MNFSRDGSKALDKKAALTLRSASGLEIKASTGSSDGVLREFYDDYDRSFVLANEKEDFDGFAECFALNSGKAYELLVKKFGPFREFVIVADDPATGIRIGGANFIVACIDLPGADRPGGFSINLNYIFINPEARRSGYFTRLMTDFPDIATGLFAMTNPDDYASAQAAGAAVTHHAGPLVFIEQNDPFRMSAEDYEADSAFTGLDQLERIAMWAKMGAKIVDFDYVQPPLSAGQSADTNLVYAVLGSSSPHLDACILLSHLTRFFGISVLKGGDIQAEPSAARQITALTQACGMHSKINLLEVSPDLLRSQRDKRQRLKLDSLRSFLKSPALG